ncbi:MAG: nucleotidyltransferase substrate binding protein [Desulfobulbaceae bacterium]|nr:nucleotidyltransferase substrate binding protein [Candidatus Kapabacteria bacterium]MBS3999467.1 nucleotidyltransferase substrate binding protein [Desulfobulbaceae bacterium]
MAPKNKRQLRFENYCKALESLNKGATHFDKLNELEKDGLVQRFGYTFDLAWKVMQDYIVELGYNDIKGPRPVMTQMAAIGFIDPFTWEEILEARNSHSHIYDETVSRQYLKQIISDFLPEFNNFKSKMQNVDDSAHNLSELNSLGSDVWKDIDIEQHIQKERNWD